jgi:hypothetical protein
MEIGGSSRVFGAMKNGICRLWIRYAVFISNRYLLWELPERYNSCINIRMREMHCQRCGAISTIRGDAAICTYCGSQLSAPVGAVISFGRRHFWVFVWAIVFLLVERPPKEVLLDFGVLLSIFAVGLLWFLVIRAIRKIEKDEVVVEWKVDRYPTPILVSELRPPDVPTPWRTLMESRPPRDVYLPAKAQVTFLFATACVSAVLIGLPLLAASHHKSIFQLYGSPRAASDLLSLLGGLTVWVLQLKALLTTRDILRNGEATVAYTQDQTLNHATYRFWTRSGQCFERGTAVISKTEFSKLGLCAVFYLPQDPRKSIALCGTEFRVRLAESSVPLARGKIAPGG